MFIKFSTISWYKTALVVGAATAFWTSLVTIVPEKYHHTGMVILGAVGSAVTFLLNAKKEP